MNHSLSGESLRVIKRLDKSEIVELDIHIHEQYGVSFECSVFRDDILEKLSELIAQEAIVLILSPIEERDRLFEDMMFSGDDVINFRILIEKEFSLESISIKVAHKWKIVGDIVTYIENEMENKNG
jgi:hypothetical protein